MPKPARLLMSVMHPLAQGDRRCGIADAVTGGSGSSILSLPQQPEAWPACGDVASGDHAVLSLALDLAGQDTPPFSPGLLPGACCCWLLPALRGGRDRAGRPGMACSGHALPQGAKRPQG